MPKRLTRRDVLRVYKKLVKLCGEPRRYWMSPSGMPGHLIMEALPPPQLEGSMLMGPLNPQPAGAGFFPSQDRILEK